MSRAKRSVVASRRAEVGTDGWLIVHMSRDLAAFYETLAARTGMPLSQLTERWLRVLPDADRHVRLAVGTQPADTAELMRGLGNYLGAAAAGLDVLRDLVAARPSFPLPASTSTQLENAAEI